MFAAHFGVIRSFLNRFSCRWVVYAGRVGDHGHGRRKWVTSYRVTLHPRPQVEHRQDAEKRGVLRGSAGKNVPKRRVPWGYRPTLSCGEKPLALPRPPPSCRAWSKTSTYIASRDSYVAFLRYGCARGRRPPGSERADDVCHHILTISKWI